MPISFDCACGKPLKVDDSFAGKRAQCPACQQVVPVPLKSKLRVQVVEEAPKRKKKKRKQVEGISKEEYEEWSETSARRAYYAKRLVYLIAGSATIVIALVALLIFAANGMMGLYPLAAVGAGLLGGAYVVFQGITGTFHER